MSHRWPARLWLIVRETMHSHGWTHCCQLFWSKAFQLMLFFFWWD
jgi:hypothetical protein